MTKVLTPAPQQLDHMQQINLAVLAARMQQIPVAGDDELLKQGYAAYGDLLEAIERCMRFEDQYRERLGATL